MPAPTAVSPILTDLLGLQVARLVDDNTPGSNKLMAGAAVFGVSETTPYVQRTVTGIAFTGPCELSGFDCTVAAGNITIYDGTDTSGPVIVPTQALAVGRTEFAYKRQLLNGCYVVLSGAATVNVLVG